MDVFYSIISMFFGIGVMVYANKERKESESIWDIVMNYRGLVGGLLFVVIGIVTLIRGW